MTSAPMAILERFGANGEPRSAPPWGPHAGSDPVGYRRWLEERDRTEDLSSTGPRISVVVPVFRPELAHLRSCVDSVRSQHYVDWQLCLCDDGSGVRPLRRFLERLARRSGRINVVVEDANGGISAATNRAASLATGEYLAFLDQDDALAPDALAQVAAALARDPDAQVLYTDEDKIDADGLLFEPNFKPDWAPDLLLTYPYLGHLLVVRRDLFDALGGLRSEFDGSQDYDLMLRATERTDRIVHVPEPLYHWRAIPGSAAADPLAKPWGHDASRRALEDALVRRGVEAAVEDTGFAPGWYHVRRRARPETSVSVIVPFRDQAAMTARCIESLTAAPGHDHYEVVAVDNASTEPETLALRRRLAGEGVRVLDHPGGFNWSAINNRAAATCDTDLLVFVNNDVEAVRGGWLSALVELAERPDVGAVGARLVFPDGTLQHGGIVIGLGGVAGHVLAGLPPGQHGYFAWDAVVRPYSAVTGACLASRREVFEAVGGFDETLGMAFNDVDYCMRVGDRGLAVLYTPHAELVHHESATRGMSGWTGDVGPFVTKWGRERLWADPLYNPNLDLFASWCPLRTKGERAIWDSVADRYLGVGGSWPG
jgi:O-antigen biosynthesis protein